MRVAIVGAGSIGAVLGAKLAATGHQVVLIARGAHLDAIRRDGLKVVDRVGEYSGTYRLRAGDDPAEFGDQDLVIIGLKAHAIAAMLPKIRPLIDDHTVVVPAINGLPWWYFHGVRGQYEGMTLRALDPERSMFAALAPVHILGCVVHIAAEVRAAGEVHHTNGKRLILGEPSGALSERLQQVCAALDAADFEAVRSADIRRDIWTKLVGNLSFNPIAALTGYLMDQIVADDAVLDVIRAMIREGMQVSEHYGVRIPMTIEERIDIARQLGAAKISMLQDLQQRRKLEIDAIVGAVIELAERASIAVPTTRHVHALTQARARVLGIA